MTTANLPARRLVELNSVTCSYGFDPVLVNVDLAIDEGQFSGVVGPSGSGKTTVLHAITGSLAPVSGKVVRRRHLTIGYVPQVETVNWGFPVTVGQCVLMARTRGRILPWASAAERDEVASILERLGLSDLVDRHIRELSGGQQQRMFIARALLQRPQLLLLDEPTSGVDVRTRHEVLHLLDELNANGLAIVLTTHDLNGIAAHLPHVVCLNREVIGTGTPREVLTPAVLEKTYGATMDVLHHGGMPVVVDQYESATVVGMRRRASGS